MKTRIIALFAGLLAVLPMTSAWAGASYYKVALTAMRGTGCGKIYACEGNPSSPQYQATDMSVDGNGTDKNTTHTFYVYAQHKYGYKFSSWSGPAVTDDQSANKGSASCADDQKLIENGCKVTVTSGSKDFGDNGGTQTTTATITANYIVCTPDDEAGTLTFVSNSGVLSYSATSPVGFPEVPAGGTKPFYKNDVDTTWKITAKGQDGYKLTGWKVTKNGVASTPSGDTLSLSIDATSSPILVEAIFEQVSYQIGDVFKKTFDEALAYANENSIKAITLVANSTYDGDLTIPSGLTLTVGAGLTLAVNGSLTVAGTLSNKGTVAPTGAMSVSGTLTNNSGSTLTIAAGQRCELATSAKVTNNGTINGSGQLVVGTIAITQDAAVTKCGYDSDGNSHVDFGGLDEKLGVRYHKGTKVVKTTATFTGTDPSAKIVWRISINGSAASEFEAKSALAQAVVCTIDPDVALNHITEVYQIYGSFSAAVADSKNQSKRMLVLAGTETSYNYDSSGKESFGSGLTVDCAGNKFAFSGGKQCNGRKVITFLNGTGGEVSVNKITQTCARFINCKAAKVGGINANQDYYDSCMLVYDCESITPTFESSPKIMTGNDSGDTKRTHIYGGVYIFSGGPFEGLNLTKNFYLYGGQYKQKNNKGVPTDSNCNIASGLAVLGPDNSVYTVGKAVVAKKIKVEVDGSVLEKGTLAEAMTVATGTAAKPAVITIPEDIVLDVPVEIAEGQHVLVALNGSRIEANKGAFVNYGNLTIDGDGAGLNEIVAVGDNPMPILTNKGGEMHLAYGTYAGEIRLEGGKLFTHAGIFEASLTLANSSCQAPTELAAVNGGTFASDKYSFNGESRDLVELCPSEYYVRSDGKEPEHFVTMKDLDMTIERYLDSRVGGNDCDVAYSFLFLSDDDRALYKKNIARANFTSLTDWYRRAELSAIVTPVIGGRKLDCTISFDRTVSDGWISAYGSVIALPSLADGGPLDRTLLARGNHTWRVADDNGTQGHVKGAYEDNYFYYVLDENGAIRGFDNFMLDCGGGATFGIQVNNTEVIGTTCYIDMIICNRRSQSDMLTYAKSLATRQFVFGAGSNVAMIRPAEGAATFYPTLKAAFEAAKNGEAVMLCNDCTACEPIAAKCSFKFDANGFKFGGEISAKDGFIAKKNGEVYSVDKAAEEVAEVEIALAQGETQDNKVSVKVEDDWAKDVTANGKTVAEALKETEENGLKVWENKLVEQAEAKGDVGHGFAAVSKTETIIDGKAVVETVVTENKSMESSSYSVADLETGTYQPTKIVKDASGADIAVPDVEKPALNVVKNESKNQTVVLAIPGNTTVNDAIAMPNKDDEIQVYDVDKGVYLCWTYGEAGWSPKKTQIGNETVEPPSADSQPLTSGMAVVYIKSDASKVVRVAAEGDGVLKTELRETTTETDEAKGKWNLVANPTKADFDLNKIDENQDDGHAVAATDRIVVLAETGLGRVDFKKKGEGGKWGRWKTTEYQDAKGKWRTKTEWVEGATLKKGQAMWYISNGGNPQIKWNVK